MSLGKLCSMPPAVITNSHLQSPFFSYVSSHNHLSLTYPSPRRLPVKLRCKTPPGPSWSLQEDLLLVLAIGYELAFLEEESRKGIQTLYGYELAFLEEESREGIQTLYECLELVDLIQRLGIHRYFEQHIKRILKTAYILHVRDTILGYKRLKSNQYENTSLVHIEGVNTKEVVARYCGKRLTYIYRVKVKKDGSHYHCIWGKVVRPHVNSGVVRAKFESNLLPKAMGSKVRVFMYPSNI